MKKILLDLDDQVYCSWKFSDKLIQDLIDLSNTNDFYVEYTDQVFISCDYFYDESLFENGIMQSICIRLKNGKLVKNQCIEFEYELMNTKSKQLFLNLNDPFLWINGIYSSAYNGPDIPKRTNFTFGSAWVTERA